jgi:hypothetical protein
MADLMAQLPDGLSGARLDPPRELDLVGWMATPTAKLVFHWALAREE